MERSRNNGIINFPTQLHLVGHFYMICIMMHVSIECHVRCVFDKDHIKVLLIFGYIVTDTVLKTTMYRGKRSLSSSKHV